jgi:Tfp pilus assembly PilM family ATPase
VLTPLWRELRASIDYFEHQQDRTIGQVYVSGAAAASDYMIEILKSELMVQCVPWSPVAPLTLSLPPEQLGELEGAAARLAVAVGAGLAVM